MSRYGFVALVGAIVLVLDQLTKIWVRATFQLYETVPVIDGLFHFTYVHNPGGAFGMLRDADESIRIPFFLIVSVIAVGALILFVRDLPTELRVLQFALGLVLGGALGNLIDRVWFGHVTDFLDVFWGSYHWPAFNIADSGISVGIVILLYYTLITPEPKKAAAPTADAGS
jgi:signal peptidase II